jgi:hypothetical protein
MAILHNPYLLTKTGCINGHTFGPEISFYQSWKYLYPDTTSGIEENHLDARNKKLTDTE